MKRIFYISFVIFFIFLVLLSINNSRELYSVDEESSPIREGNTIVGMNYTITIGKDVKRNDINISTAILSSILHYKDIDNINDFYVDLKINNKSKKNYILKNIILVSNGGLINKKVKYKNNSNYVSIRLKKEDFLNYNSGSFIKLELEK